MPNKITEKSVHLLRYIQQKNYILVEDANIFTDNTDLFNPYLQELNDEKLIEPYNLSQIKISLKGIAYLEELDAQKMEKQKKYIHDWKIAIFSSVFGGLSGFITSLIFWLLSK